MRVRIVQLLRSTELTIAEIAKRMDVSHTVVAKINRIEKVREYITHARWRIDGETYCP
jgi:hypothetical protein